MNGKNELYVKLTLVWHRRPSVRISWPHFVFSWRQPSVAMKKIEENIWQNKKKVITLHPKR